MSWQEQHWDYTELVNKIVGRDPSASKGYISDRQILGLPGGDYLLWVVVLDISANWPKIQNFVPPNISYLCTIVILNRKLEYVEPIPFPHKCQNLVLTKRD